MAIPSILARIAAGVASEAIEDSEASLMATLAEHLGVPFPKDSDSLTLPVASSAISAIGYKSPDTITVVFKRASPRRAQVRDRTPLDIQRARLLCDNGGPRGHPSPA